MRAALRLAFVATLGVSWLLLLSVLAKKLLTAHSTNVDAGLALPRSFEGLREMLGAWSGVIETQKESVMALFCLLYCWKQAFAVPGSALLFLAAGHIFGMAVGLPLICFLTACGASGCYLMSQFVGSDTIREASVTARAHLDSVRSAVSRERQASNLFIWLCTARLFLLRQTGR